MQKGLLIGSLQLCKLDLELLTITSHQKITDINFDVHWSWHTVIIILLSVLWYFEKPAYLLWLTVDAMQI